jgi:hypothetical protein
MSADPMLEISTALADLADVMERNGAADAIGQAVRDAALEIGTPLADLLVAIERSGPATAKAIAEAIGKLQMPQPAAPIVHVAAPAVTLEMPDPPEGWRFDVDYHVNGSIKGLTAKRLHA